MAALRKASPPAVHLGDTPSTPARDARTPPRSPATSNTQQYLRPSHPSSPASTTYSSISDHDYAYTSQVSQAEHLVSPVTTRDNHGQAQPRPALISHARRGSASSGRLLHLGSVHDLGDGRGSLVIGQSRTGTEQGSARSSFAPEVPQKDRRGLDAPSHPRPYLQLAPSSSTAPPSRDSIVSLSPTGLASLPFPSPPARAVYSPSPSTRSQSKGQSPSGGKGPYHAHSPPPLAPNSVPTSPSIYAPHTPRNWLPRSPAPSLPLSPSSATHARYGGPGSPHHAAPRPASTRPRRSRSFLHRAPSRTPSAVAAGPASAFPPVRTIPESGPSRLSAYDPLAGEISDVATRGSASPWAANFDTPPSSAEIRPSGRPAGAQGQGAAVPAVDQASNSSSRTRSTKSTKSAKSGRSARSAQQSASRKWTSGSSLAYRLADMSWTLRPTSPWEDGEEGLLEEDEGDIADGGGHGGGNGGVETPTRPKRKKSIRTVRKEEQDLDLGRLLGRAAVLEKILNAGKRVSNQSIRHQPFRASDTTLPSVPRRTSLQRALSAMSTRTIDTSQSHSTHHSNPDGQLPPVPPIPHSGRSSLSLSVSSSLGKARIRLARRVRRDGEWGGDGYSSLPGSERGSRTHLPLSSGPVGAGAGEELVVPLPRDDTPPLPPKPTFLGWRRNSNLLEKGDEVRETIGCFDGPIHRHGEIILPPSCIPIGAHHPDQLSPLRNSRANPDMDRPLPSRPVSTYDPFASEPEKGAYVYRQHPPARRSQMEGAQQRGSRVLSYVSTGQASLSSRRRWVIWVGAGCLVGLGVVTAVLAGVLASRKEG